MAQQLYCVQADLEARFTAERVAEVFSVQAADGSTTGVADNTSVLAACTDASAFVGQYLIGIHGSTMPFPTVPEAVRMHACAIAMFFGMRRRPEHRGVKYDAIPFYLEYTEAKEGLKLVREGLLRLAPELKPANSGGTFATAVAVLQRPGTFVPDPTTGEGGFNAGDF